MAVYKTTPDGGTTFLTVNSGYGEEGFYHVTNQEGVPIDDVLVNADGSNRAIQLPPGDMLLNKPFNPGGVNPNGLGGRSGGLIQGHGNSEYSSLVHPNAGPASCFRAPSTTRECATPSRR